MLEREYLAQIADLENQLETSQQKEDEMEVLLETLNTNIEASNTEKVSPNMQ